MSSCFHTLSSDLATIPKRDENVGIIILNMREGIRGRECNKRRLAASDCQEGNRREYSMSDKQTSGKEGGVQCVMTVIYMLDIVCLSDQKETQACRLIAGQVPVYILRPEIRVQLYFT